MKTITEILELIVWGFFIVAVCLCISGCGTMSKMKLQADGTYKKVPIMTAETFLVDLDMSESETKILTDAEFILLDGTKVKAKSAIITTEKHYSTKGRSEGLAKQGANLAQGAFQSVM